MTCMKFKLVTDRSMYVKCVQCVQMYKLCIEVMSVLSQKPREFCGSALQYITVTVPADRWPPLWVGEISLFIHVALKDG